MDNEKLRKALNYQGEGFGEWPSDIESHKIAMVKELFTTALEETFQAMQKDGEGLTLSQKRALLKGLE